MKVDDDDLLNDFDGRRLTEEISEALVRNIKSKTGIELSEGDIGHLWLANLGVLTKEPATIESRNALMDFEKSAARLITVLRRIEYEAEKGAPVEQQGSTSSRVVLQRKNLAEWFLAKPRDFSAIGIKPIYNNQGPTDLQDPREYVENVISSVALLQERAKIALRTAKKVKHGGGRQEVGYDKFILACHRIWTRHRLDKGYSRKSGRGDGAFVRFVYVAQGFLPRGVRKDSEAAVGDAVVTTLKDTSPK